MRKLFSYFIDYIWFSLFLVSLLFKLNFTLFPMILALLLVPLLYIPFDALFLRLSCTSMGKSLFSLYAFENKRPSFITSFKEAFKQGLFNQTLLIPILNFFTIRYRKYLNLSLTIEKNCFKEKLVSLLTIVMMIMYAFFSNEMIVQKCNKYFATHNQQKVDITINESWVEYKDTDLNYSIHFPSEIKNSSTIINIPRSSRVLNLSTLSAVNDNITYSVTHTKLPSAWVRWSQKLALNGALKAIATYEGGVILSQKNLKIQKKSALEYTIQVGNTLKKGQLLLDKNRLYQIQGEHLVSIPLEKEQEESINHFIHLFCPNP